MDERHASKGRDEGECKIKSEMDKAEFEPNDDTEKQLEELEKAEHNAEAEEDDENEKTEQSEEAATIGWERTDERECLNRERESWDETASIAGLEANNHERGRQWIKAEEWVEDERAENAATGISGLSFNAKQICSQVFQRKSGEEVMTEKEAKEQEEQQLAAAQEAEEVTGKGESWEGKRSKGSKLCWYISFQCCCKANKRSWERWRESAKEGEPHSEGKEL